jgi:hypothetical protein
MPGHRATRGRIAQAIDEAERERLPRRNIVHRPFRCLQRLERFARLSFRWAGGLCLQRDTRSEQQRDDSEGLAHGWSPQGWPQPSRGPCAAAFTPRMLGAFPPRIFPMRPAPMRLNVLAAALLTATLAACQGQQAPATPDHNPQATSATAASQSDAQFAGITQRWLDGWMKLNR